MLLKLRSSVFSKIFWANFFLICFKCVANLKIIVMFCRSSFGEGREGTPYKGLYEATPPERGILF